MGPRGSLLTTPLLPAEPASDACKTLACPTPALPGPSGLFLKARPEPLHSLQGVRDPRSEGGDLTGALPAPPLPLGGGIILSQVWSHPGPDTPGGQSPQLPPHRVLPQPRDQVGEGAGNKTPSAPAPPSKPSLPAVSRQLSSGRARAALHLGRHSHPCAQDLQAGQGGQPGVTEPQLPVLTPFLPWAACGTPPASSRRPPAGP